MALWLAGVSVSCNSPEPAAPPHPLTAPAARPVAPVKPRAVPAPPLSPVAAAVAPRQELPWKGPAGAITKVEALYVGTWVATVGDYATRTAFMADKDTAGVTPAGALAAMAKDDSVKTHCVWMELRKDHKGVRRECALVSGKPTMLDLTDPISGQKHDAETPLEWYFDGAAKAVQIRAGSDLFVPAPDDHRAGSRLLRFRRWTLTPGRKADQGIEMQEAVPEHGYTLPARYVYEVFMGHFLGDPGAAAK